MRSGLAARLVERARATVRFVSADHVQRAVGVHAGDHGDEEHQRQVRVTAQGVKPSIDVSFSRFKSVY